MAVHFATDRPRALLNAFDAAIEQKEAEGKIRTWIKSDDGVYYTHAATAWTKKAWFKPSVESGQLTFNIIKPGDENVTIVAYGYYHGHLIETFLNHFDKMHTLAMATPLPVKGDLVG